jgi:AcrR family transcriptional regulator
MQSASKVSTLKEKQRAERTALILDAAYAVLVERGYHEASMDEIATRVGISKGALYLHFESKEHLIFSLIDQEIIKFLAVVDQVIEEEVTVRARLEHILLETYKGIQHGHQFLLALRAIGISNSAIAERLEEQVAMRGLVDRLAALFEEGKHNGELDATVPTTILVSMFLGLMRMHDNQQLVSTNELSPQKLVQSASRVFFEGILASRP